MALLRTVGLLQGGEGVLAKTFGSAVTPLRSAASAMIEVTSAQDRARLSTQALTAVEAKRQATVRAGLVQLGKGAALVGGLAVAQTGLAESTGLSNTASFALMGTIAGPWGTAVGAGIGLVTDLAAANHDLEDAVRRADEALKDPLDFSQQKQEIEALGSTIRTSLAVDNGSLSGLISASVRGINSIPSMLQGEDPTDAAVAKQHELQVSLLASRQGLAEFYAALNGGDLTMLYATDEELLRFVNEIAPAFRTAGLDLTEVLTTRAGWGEALLAVKAYTRSVDTASGRSKSVGAAFGELANQMEPAVTEAEALKSALDALFGPELSASEATDRWVESVRNIRVELAKTNGVIKGNSQAALDNRDVIRGSLQDLTDRISALAATGVGEKRLTRLLKEGRQAIIDQAVAAGAKRQDIADYVNQLNLTPKNIKTIIEVATDKARADVRKLRDDLAGLSKIEIAIEVARVTKNGVPGIAGGGLMRGPGTGTSDSIPAYLSNGEYVIREAAVRKYGVHMFDELNSARFATGGLVGKLDLSKDILGNISIAADLDTREITELFRNLAAALKDSTSSIEDQEAAFRRAESRLDELSAGFTQTATTVAGQFKTSIVDAASSSGSRSSDVVRSSINTSLLMDSIAADRFTRLLKKAERLGLSGGLLDEVAASGDMRVLQALASSSRGQIRDLEWAYAQRASSTRAAGRAAGEATFGPEIRDEIRGLREEIRDIGARGAGVAISKQSVRDLGRAVGGELNGAARAAVRRP
jgi:hypothetical protein